MVTVLSDGSMLQRLALELRASEESVAPGLLTLVIDGKARRYGTEGLKSTVIDVRAGRIHAIDLGYTEELEKFLINYWGTMQF